MQKVHLALHSLWSLLQYQLYWFPPDCQPIRPVVGLQSLGNSSRFPSPGEQFHFCKPAKLTKHWRRNESVCTPGAYRGFINHTCCSAVRGMISAACVFSSMWPKVWEEQREESIYTHMALSSENLLLFILMMEINHFQLTHMNTLTRLHTCRVTLWHGGDSETPCVWFLIACGYSDAGDKVTKGFGIGLLLLNRPIGREKEGACSQAEPMGDGRQVGRPYALHGFCSSWQHTHTRKGMTQVCRDMCDGHTMSPAGWTALPSQIDIRQTDAGQIHIMTWQFLI